MVDSPKSASKVVMQIINTETGETFNVGYVENLSWTENYIVEEKRGIGDEVSKALVKHGKNAINFNWSKSFLTEFSVKDKQIVPKVVGGEFVIGGSGYHIRLADKNTGATLWMLTELAVTSYTLNVTQMATIMESCNGLGLLAYDRTELT